MDVTTNLSLRFARPLESKVERNASLPNGPVLQRIATRMSLVSQAIGFSAFGILIIVNRHQEDLNGLAGGSAVAIVGGISAILVGTGFFAAACLHWRFCARHPATLAVWRQSARLIFAGLNPITAMALLSA
jgi:hypothetical protein